MSTNEELGGKESVLKLQKEYMNQLNGYYKGPLLITAFPKLKPDFKEFLKSFSYERKNTYFHDDLPNIFDIPHATLPDIHPSKLGHALIAEDILHYLVDKKILNCSLK